MKKTILIAFLFSIISYGQVFEQKNMPDKWYSTGQNGKNRINIISQEDLLKAIELNKNETRNYPDYLERREYDENGILIFSWTYNLKPFKRSKSTHYYDSGQVKHLIKFKKDTDEKESAFNYYENGQVKTSASYKYKYYNTDVDHESVVEVNGYNYDGDGNYYHQFYFNYEDSSKTKFIDRVIQKNFFTETNDRTNQQIFYNGKLYKINIFSSPQLMASKSDVVSYYYSELIFNQNSEKPELTHVIEYDYSKKPIKGYGSKESDSDYNLRMLKHKFWKQRKFTNYKGRKNRSKDELNYISESWWPAFYDIKRSIVPDVYWWWFTDWSLVFDTTYYPEVHFYLKDGKRFIYEKEGKDPHQTGYEFYIADNHIDSKFYPPYERTSTMKVNFGSKFTIPWCTHSLCHPKKKPDDNYEMDLDYMIGIFLEDCKNNNLAIKDNYNIKATFEPLQGNLMALAYGINDDSNIVLKVDPEMWSRASSETRWYILYHELGHDVLNFEHGQGGSMMFNFADKDYTWDDFAKDRDYMFDKYKSNTL